ncbi:ABC transporter substrate-binding protein [Halorussus salinisoli]|uniref:ABC transporter substrate-binding protein n=1 Tax=Halorussus salinisoli TaxID=2558242 RepID=UPI0010C1AC03|nr:ABC transporter substrate-binding protein [Halorussus salinisoli]
MGPRNSRSAAESRGLDWRRRSVLAGIAGTASVASAGCVQQVRSIANRTPSEQVSLDVKTVPADEDPRAVKIARVVTNHLKAVGVDAQVTLMDEQELLRDVLINNEFDLYVARHPSYDDPDFLLSLLHSRFVEEPGWQNPFGFTDLGVDESLEAQRRTRGAERSEQLAELQRIVARQQPFSVVAFPDDLWAVRPDGYAGWEEFGLGRPLGYLALDADGDPPERLETVVTDDRVTANLNPIASEFRSRGTFTGLLYDSLGRDVGDGVEPWLAADWEWRDEGDDGPTATVRLREGARWHDGRRVTASDVAFTYEFLTDTSLGREESPIPAPRFRGRISLVERVRQLDDRTVEFDFVASDPAVSVRAFTVPVLPKREWKDKSSSTDVAGIAVGDRTTKALVWDNPDPIGSGPLRFEEKTVGERLVCSRFEDHFLHDADGDHSRFGADFAELVVQVAPSADAAVNFLETGRADVTSSVIPPRLAPSVVRREGLDLVAETSRSFYHLGFNVQRSPLGNPRFRRNVARLLDKEALVADVFDEYAVPAATPLAVTEWSSPDLAWDDGDPVVPFFGEDGELDAEQAREAFREAGYRYDDGDLVNR